MSTPDATSDWHWSLPMQLLMLILFGTAAWIGGYWMASPAIGPPWPFLLVVAVIFGASLLAHAVVTTPRTDVGDEVGVQSEAEELEMRWSSWG